MIDQTAFFKGSEALHRFIYTETPYGFDDLSTKFDMLTKAGIITKTFGEFVSAYKLEQQKAHADVCNNLSSSAIPGGGLLW